MKKELKILVYLDILFIILLAISGGLSGAISEAVYYSAFLLPLLVYFILQAKGRVAAEQISVFPTKESFKISLLLAMPLVAAVFLLSMLTSLIFGFLGISGGAEPIEKITLSVLISAIAPAVLEELLFRFVPLSMLKGKSTRDTVFFTALFFALAHCSLFQLPYAFFAGAVFAAADILAGSIWPSLVMHVLNNAVAVFWLRYGAEAPWLFMLVLLLLALASLLVMLVLKCRLFARMIELVKDKPTERVTPEAWVFIFTTVTIMALSLMEAIWK